MGSALLRRPAVAGYFYPADPEALRSALEAFVPVRPIPSPACGAVVPHGSFPHAGSILASTLARVSVPPVCVLIGPAHLPAASRWTVMPSGGYTTPLGESPVEESLVAELLRRCPFMEADAFAQHGEHSLEVPLTALQWLRPEGLAVVPVLVSLDDAEGAEAVGQALADMAAASKGPVMVIASADLSQFVERDLARDQALRLAEAARERDAKVFWDTIRSSGAQVCGAGAVAALLAFARRLGAPWAECVGVDTSADHGGDPYSAAGYAGLIFHNQQSIRNQQSGGSNG